jgi:arylformamidase
MGLDLSTFHAIDITPVITPKMAVFPGDIPYERGELLSFAKGHHLGLSHIKSTVHLGAHTDAPNHYDPKGVGIEARDLSLYLGSCQVIEVAVKRGERLTVKHLENKKITAPRVLFKTNSYPNPYEWNDDFCSLSAELVDELARQNVRLVGIDTPSIDLADDKELESHHRIFAHDMAVLEGIVLSKVEEGHYQLIALPLPLEGADASPVRALLLSEKK